MKKITALLLTFVLCFTLGACAKNTKEPEIVKANFDSSTTLNDFELTVNSAIVTATQLNGDEDQFDEFLTTDMTNYGDTVLCDVTLVAKEGQTMIVVAYSLKNNAQTDKTFSEKVSLNYNNGFEYEAYNKYYSFGGNDDWHEYTDLTINPLTTVMNKVYFTVPEEVANNTSAPLTLVIANQEYTIR